MVVYATSGGRRWRSGEPLEVGAEVSERQELVHLPATAAMNAEIKVPESLVSRISTGMPARVTVDALPGRVLEGVLTSIGVLPDASHSWLNPDIKVYDCDIELQGDAPDVRPGMSCKVEVVVKELPDAVYVPVQCVSGDDPGPAVYVVERGQPVRRAVTPGLDNSVMIHIREGLAEGQAVWLNPPLGQPRPDADVPESAQPDGDRAPPGAAGPGRNRKPGAAEGKTERRPRGAAGGPGATRS
jgi:HlyD family secretion protein